MKEGKSLREIGKIFATNPLRIRKILVGYGIKISKKGSWASGLTKETHDGIRRSSESKRGAPRDLETNKKISITLTGRPSPKKGKTLHLSEKTIELLRQARLHQVFPPKDAKTTEIPLQKLLKENNIKFEKHKAVLGQPDIFIKPNICIFADGDYWHANPKFYKSDSPILSSPGKKPAYKIWEKDEKINQKLIQLDYQVLRLWEYDLQNNRKKCLQKIIKIIKESRRQRG